LGHPIHFITYVLAVAAFVWATLFDLIGLAFEKLLCFSVSYWLILIAMIASSLVLVFGAIDWICMPRWMRCKAITFGNAITNLLVTLCFIASFSLRENLSHKPSKIALAYAFVGLTLALLSAWLGSQAHGNLTDLESNVFQTRQQQIKIFFRLAGSRLRIWLPSASEMGGC
jgi:uncharacterized membrane protein